MNTDGDASAPLAMDQHPELVAAAHAVRQWVHAQRRTWDAGGANAGDTSGAAASARAVLWSDAQIDAPVVANPFDAGIEVDDHLASAAAIPVPPAPPLPALIESPAFTESPLDVDVAGVSATRRASVGDAIGATVRTLREAIAVIGPLVGRSWRPAVAVAGVASLIGTGWHFRSYRPHFPEQATPAASVAPVAPAPAKSPARPAAPVRASGRLHVETDPPGARVILDGKDRGITPLTLETVSAGSHAVILRSDKGSVERTISIAGSKTTQLNEAIYSGWLHVSAPIELQLAEGSHAIRLDDSNQVLLDPGRHTIEFHNRALHFSETRQVEVTPGGTAAITIEPRPAKLWVTTSEPAEVTVDGDVVGQTPIEDHTIAIGTRDVAVRALSGNVRRFTMTVATEGLHLDVDFAKP